MSSLDAEMASAVFRLIDREVWIVTAAAGERRGGLTATWVSQASLDPARPVVIAAIAPNHYTAELIEESGAFALHLLTKAQAHLAWRFGLGSGRDRDKLAGLKYRTVKSGSPILEDCLAWLDCKVFHRYAAGDRILYWADVLAAGQPQEGEALCERELFTTATPEQLDRLQRELAADIQQQRQLLERWRGSL